MIPRWQAVLVALLLPFSVSGQEAGGKFDWKEPKVGAGLFSDELGMLDREREEYANSLAGYASNRVAEAKASPASLTDARRLVALSLHLSPRNRKALVLNFQLSRGVLPEVLPGDYKPDVLARLLFTRSELLKKQGGAENTLLARIFIEISAEMDPKNDDAVYAAEVQRLDGANVNWNAVTDSKSAAPKKGAGEGEGGVP
ncbi:hypothetical protein [Luteolibacter luteus]|uniref:Uncharacterized protein n=1 Tax=Luteolibacter luteus TaxID=2728835 RepID=A0A858RMJ2_9BACT|nr:hypothetical protein [Luteolibacter luteus]QJE97704.1 hypothetical protein HHL09_18590 [Luteolibacter luteus]